MKRVVRSVCRVISCSRGELKFVPNTESGRKGGIHILVDDVHLKNRPIKRCCHSSLVIDGVYSLDE